MKWIIALATASLLLSSCAKDRFTRYYERCVGAGVPRVECEYRAETLRMQYMQTYPWWIGR